MTRPPAKIQEQTMRLPPLVCFPLSAAAAPFTAGISRFPYRAHVLFKTWKCLYIQNGLFRQIAFHHLFLAMYFRWSHGRSWNSCATFLWSRFATHTGCAFQTLTVTGFLALAQFSPFQCQLLSWLRRLTHSCQKAIRSHTSDLGHVKKGLFEWTLDIKQPSCNDLTHLARPHYGWCWNV